MGREPHDFFVDAYVQALELNTEILAFLIPIV